MISKSFFAIFRTLPFVFLYGDQEPRSWGAFKRPPPSRRWKIQRPSRARVNYRPISLTSVCCKTVERLVCSHITKYLEENHLLSDHQFGFRSGLSTIDQLFYIVLVYKEESKCVDRGKLIDVVLFEFSKAFDVVHHPILLNKLHCSIGIQGEM